MQNFFLSNEQYFEFVQNDIAILKTGMQITYAIDSYDAASIVFNYNIFSSSSNEHFKLLRSTWLQLLDDIKDYDDIILSIGPLALLESILNLKKNAQDVINNEIFSVVKDFDIDMLISDLKESSDIVIDAQNVPWNVLGRTIKKAWSIMSKNLALQDTLLNKNETGIRLLLKMIQNDEIKYLENLLNEHSLILDYNEFEAPNPFVNPRQGLNYLGRKRGREYWKKIYNAIDIFRLVAAANIKPLLQKVNIESFIISNGQLTLNAWDYSWKGYKELWPVRPTQSVAYLVHLKKMFSSDWKVMKQEAEEASYAARHVLRGLNEIEAVRRSVEKDYREKADKKMIISISDELVLDILHWNATYYNKYCPKELRDFINNDSKTIDLIKLKELSNSDEARQNIHDQIKEATIDFIANHSFLDFERMPFYGPLNDAYIDLNKWLHS